MKAKLFFAAATLALALSASADDQLRSVQTELKNQGFYYGEVDGQKSSEMTSALRRYQIRNGLEVTGTLNQETLGALGMATAQARPSTPPPATVAQTPSRPAAKPAPPVNIRRNETVEDGDKAFLRREEAKSGNSSAAPSRASQYNEPPPAPRDPSVVLPPAPLEAPSADFPVLFANTPYANAPLAVQRDTLRRAQMVLASQGFYRDVVDGLPGPATEESLLTYQRAARLTLSGRLDLDTLNRLHLLPGNVAAQPAPQPGPQFGIEFRMPHHVFRGIWVDRN